MYIYVHMYRAPVGFLFVQETVPEVKEGQILLLVVIFSLYYDVHFATLVNVVWCVV